MRSMTLQNYSTVAAVLSLAAAAAEAANVTFLIPTEQIQLAWTLARVLLQL
jgi:hypothetical protein